MALYPYLIVFNYPDVLPLHRSSAAIGVDLGYETALGC